MKSRMTIGTKMVFAVSGMLGLTMLLGYVSLSAIATLRDETHTITTATTRKTDLNGQLQAALFKLRVDVRGYVLYSMLKDVPKVEQADRGYQATSSEIRKIAAEIRPLLVTDRGKEDLNTIEGTLEGYNQVFQTVRQDCAGQQFGSVLEGHFDEAVILGAKAIAASNDLGEIQRDLLAASDRDVEQLSSRSHWLALLLILLSLGAGAAAIFVVRHVNLSLRKVARELAEGADQVATAASQISSSSQSLAQGTSQQAASLEETSATTEEINSMNRKSAENSKGAADCTAQANERIGLANRNLEQMMKAMGEINSSSDKISKIIKVIDEIAFQTNILALNAAVEAARAGEAGMGFAVVADEVRNLAQRCAQAARDTSVLIEDSITKSVEGKVKLDEVVKVIQGVTESVAQVKVLVDEVSVGSEEQTRGSDQIAHAITQIEQVTQKSAASAEESASAGEELSAQSAVLRELVNQLTDLVGRADVRGRAGSGTNRRAKTAAANRPALELAAAGSSKKNPLTFQKRPMRNLGPVRPNHEPRPAVTSIAAAKQSFPLDKDFAEF